MHINEIEELKKNPILRKKIEEIGMIKFIKQDEIILREDAYINSIPILLSGLLKITRADNEGKDLLMYYIEPGESCVMSMLGGLYNERSHIKATAEENSELLLIPISESEKWIKEFPEWSIYFFRIFQRRFEELLSVVESLAYQKMDVRLLQHLQKKSQLNHNKVIITTHQQLAEELGTVREVVSRVLKMMEKEGLVQLSRNKITLM